jgi:hypothetical protein
MNQKKSRGISFYLKLVLGLVCAFLGLKLFLSVLSAFAVGLTLFTVALYGLGFLAIGGGVIYAATKLLGSKKR